MNILGGVRGRFKPMLPAVIAVSCSRLKDPAEQPEDCDYGYTPDD